MCAARSRAAVCLSLSSVFSYVLSLDHSGSADGRGMTAGWSRKTTMLLSARGRPATNPRLGSFDRGSSREPQHDARELNHEEKVLDNMLAVITQPLKVKRRPHASCGLVLGKRRTSSDQHPGTKKKEVTQGTCQRKMGDGRRKRGRTSHLYITLLPDASIACSCSPAEQR